MEGVEIYRRHRIGVYLNILFKVLRYNSVTGLAQLQQECLGETLNR